MCCFFFFQAEDGIRDAQESRGLGDVYKRQRVVVVVLGSFFDIAAVVQQEARYGVHQPFAVRAGAVSYTHLTLPTIYSV